MGKPDFVVAVLANDSYGSSPTVTIEIAPSSGTAVVNGDNTVTYTPQLGSGGVVTFTYSLSEGGASDTALVTVTVVPPAAADFVGNPTGGVAPLTVVFSDTSTGSPTAWVAALGAVWRRGGEYGAKPDACLHLWCPPSRGATR